MSALTIFLKKVREPGGLPPRPPPDSRVFPARGSLHFSGKNSRFLQKTPGSRRDTEAVCGPGWKPAEPPESRGEPGARPIVRTARTLMPPVIRSGAGALRANSGKMRTDRRFTPHGGVLLHRGWRFATVVLPGVANGYRPLWRDSSGRASLTLNDPAGPPKPVAQEHCARRARGALADRAGERPLAWAIGPNQGSADSWPGTFPDRPCHQVPRALMRPITRFGRLRQVPCQRAHS